MQLRSHAQIYTRMINLTYMYLNFNIKAFMKLSFSLRGEPTLFEIQISILCFESIAHFLETILIDLGFSNFTNISNHK